jgi:hypothetical protein
VESKVASNPALKPPNQALTITGVKNNKKGASCPISGSNKSLTERAIPTLKIGST